MEQSLFVAVGLGIGLFISWLVRSLWRDDDYSYITTTYIIRGRNGELKVDPKKRYLRYPGHHNFVLKTDAKVEIEFEEKKRKKGPLKEKPGAVRGIYKLDQSNPEETDLETDTDPGKFSDYWKYTVIDLSTNKKIDPGIRIKK